MSVVAAGAAILVEVYTLLTLYRRLYPKSSPLRLYTKVKDGGRTLVSIRATIQDETSKSNESIRKKVPRS